MIITDYNLHTTADLFDIIRKTRLAGNANIKPFKNSKLSIRTVTFCDLSPSKTFVLQERMDKIDEVYQQMLTHGLNVFQMDGFLTYKIHGVNGQFVFTPPIIEVIGAFPTIIDGHHRIKYAAEHDNMPFKALFINEIETPVWPNASPLRGGWKSVQKFQRRAPDGFERTTDRYNDDDAMSKNQFYEREYPFPGIVHLGQEVHTR